MDALKVSKKDLTFYYRGRYSIKKGAVIKTTPFLLYNINLYYSDIEVSIICHVPPLLLAEIYWNAT
jgi:hypothetical protein